VVVGDFDLVGISLLPMEADSILLVDSNAVLSAPLARKKLQTVPGRDGQFAKIPNAI